MNTRAFLLSALLSLVAVSGATAQTGSASTPAKTTCPTDTSIPSDADKLLASKDYKGAEAKYREGLAKQPDSDDMRLGVIRSLIGEDRVTEAQAEATSFLQAKPKDAVAEVAMAEALYRAADVTNSYAHAKAAFADNMCDGRSSMVMSDLYYVSGLFEHASKFTGQAHRLRPNDELIRREWIETLPRKQRLEELNKYLAATHDLSADDSRDYSNEVEHLKARRPGECRITSAAEETKTPMQPVYGDNTRPVAYGLDVSFNGKRRRMQIDTGASGIVLSQSAARGLGLEKEFRLKTGGVGDEGDVDSYLAHVPSIKIGDVEVSNCMVEVISQSKLDVDGLIGMDVFARWLVTLDYQNAQLRLAPLPPRPGEPATKKLDSDPEADESDLPAKDSYVAPEMQSWRPILRIGHEIFLPASLKKDGPTHYLIMDTGAGQSSLSTAMGKEAGKLHGSDAEFVGISGKVNKVYETNDVELTVANLRIPAVSYYAYDFTKISHNSGFETSGLLGLPTLQRLTIQIDYRDNLLKLSYDPKHDLQRF